MPLFCQPAESRAQIIVQYGDGGNILIGSDDEHVGCAPAEKYPAVVVPAQHVQQVALPIAAESVLVAECSGPPDCKDCFLSSSTYVEQGQVVFLQKPACGCGRRTCLAFGSGGFLQTHQLADTFHDFIRYAIVLFHA